MIAWLVVNGLGAGLHRLVVATGAGCLDQIVIGEVCRADPAELGLADVLIEPPHASSAESLTLIVVALGFPKLSNRRFASP